MIPLVVILGPTASGKTDLSISLIKKYKGDIVSADSRQVYKELDIGVGKELEKYDKAKVKYPFFINHCSLTESFNLFTFQKLAYNYINKIYLEKKTPFLVGGSILYIKALLDNYNLKSYQSYKENKHLIFKTLLLSPFFPRNELHKRIKKRLIERWEKLKVETQDLLDNNISSQRLNILGLEYKYMLSYIEKNLSEEEAFNKLLIKIRNFARRQDIWLRKLEKEGKDIYFLQEEDKLSEAEKYIKLFLSDKKLPKINFRLSQYFY